MKVLGVKLVCIIAPVVSLIKDVVFSVKELVFNSDSFAIFVDSFISVDGKTLSLVEIDSFELSGVSFVDSLIEEDVSNKSSVVGLLIREV